MYLYNIYILCFSVYLSICACRSVCLYPINGKTAEAIGPNFVWEGLWMLRITDLKAFDFCEILKNARTKFENRLPFLLLFYIVQREDAHR